MDENGLRGRGGWESLRARRRVQGRNVTPPLLVFETARSHRGESGPERLDKKGK